MDALSKVGHQVTEGAGLPALIEVVEALRDAVVRGRDLVGVDRIELLSGNLWVPEDERATSDQVATVWQPVDRLRRRTYR
jgi:hypothetical protein